MWRSCRTWGTSGRRPSRVDSWMDPFWNPFILLSNKHRVSSSRMWILEVSTTESAVKPLQETERRAWEKRGTSKGEEGERKSDGSDHGFWFGVLLEAGGSPLVYEMEWRFGEAGGDRKTIKIQEWSVWFHLHMWESSHSKAELIFI